MLINNAPFWLCISKINNVFTDNAENLDIVILIYSLLENSDNFSMTSGGLQNYYRDEVNDDANENNAARIKINNYKTIAGKSFEYKTNLIRSTPNNNNILDAEVIALLKYFSNFWRYPHFSLNNCEIEIDLS